MVETDREQSERMGKVRTDRQLKEGYNTKDKPTSKYEQSGTETRTEQYRTRKH